VLEGKLRMDRCEHLMRYPLTPLPAGSGEKMERLTC
jgi:hypothetical protein